MKKILVMVMVLTMIFMAGLAYAGAEICIDVPTTSVLPRVKAAYSSKYDYENNKLDGESTAAFTKRMIIHEIKEVVQSEEKSTNINALTDNPVREDDPNNPGEYLEIE